MAQETEFKRNEPITPYGYISPLNSLVNLGFDRVDVTYPSATTEVYAFSYRTNLVAMVTLTYSDSSKENLVSAVKT